MSLETISAQFGQAGSLTQRDLRKILVELQGRTISVVAGTTALTKINVAAMRSEDTIQTVIREVAGVPSDITSEAAIVDTHATGTVTCASAVNADTVTVNGVVFTIKTTPGAPYTDVLVGGTDAVMATNLAAAINSYFGRATLTAAALNAVVTLTAVADGTAGNALTLATNNNTRLAKSGTTLSGGTATGGFTLSTTNTTGNVLVVHWVNKR